MLDGRELSRLIDSRRDQLFRDERRLVSAVEDAVRVVTVEKAREAEAWSALAAMRLQDEEGALVGRLDGAAKEAVVILERRTRRLDETRGRITELERKVDQASLSHADAAQAEAEGRAKAARRKADAVAALEADETCRAAAARVAELEAQSGRAKTKAAAAKSELAEKSRPYLAEPVFAYLWRVGFGTPAYAGTGMTRSLDGWAARVIGYEPARRNFHLLNEIPRRLAGHKDRLEQDLADARTDLDKASAVHTADAEAAAGEADALAEATKLASGVLQGLRNSLGKAGSELRKAAERKDEEWHLASAAFSRSLQTESLSRIERAAAETPGSADDDLVAKIKAARGRISEAERVVAAKEGQVSSARRRRKILEGEGEFLASNGWDDEDSLFDDALSGKFLSEIADGTGTGTGFRLRAQMSRKERPRPVERDEPSWSRDADSVWGRSERSGSSSSGGSGYSGGSSRRPTQDDDFRTGGGIGSGGGFVTGGVIGAIAGAALGGSDANANDASGNDGGSDFTTGGEI